MTDAWRLAARYLQKTDERIEEMMHRAFAQLEEKTSFRMAQNVFSVENEAPGIVCIGGHEMHSRGLSRLLKDSDRAVVYTATLGVQADALLMRAQVTDMAYALVMQSCAAALVEAKADAVLHEMEQELLREGLHLTPSFAPGYGDLPVAENAWILEAVQAEKRTGVTRTESCMLAPTKSIAAVCGITSAPCRPQKEKCSRCGMTNCAYRKG